MARTRNLKPGFFKNADLAALPPTARLLFAGLWTLADRDGRLVDEPKRIKAEILPYDLTQGVLNIELLLTRLALAGFIYRYEVDGQRLISIPTWNRHQHPHVKEPLSTLPAPVSHQSCPVQAPVLPGAGPVLAPDEPSASPVPEPVLTRKRAASTAVVETLAFTAFWQLYPRHVKKREAVQSFNRAAAAGIDPELILAGLRRQLPGMLSSEIQYRPHPSTWLNGRRWEDEITAQQGTLPLGSKPSITDQVKALAMKRINRDGDLR